MKEKGGIQRITLVLYSMINLSKKAAFLLLNIAFSTL